STSSSASSSSPYRAAGPLVLLPPPPLIRLVPLMRREALSRRPPRLYPGPFGGTRSPLVARRPTPAAPIAITARTGLIPSMPAASSPAHLLLLLLAPTAAVTTCGCHQLQQAPADGLRAQQGREVGAATPGGPGTCTRQQRLQQLARGGRGAGGRTRRSGGGGVSCRLLLVERPLLADTLAGAHAPRQRPVFIFRDGPATTAAKMGSPLLLEAFNAPSQAVTERLNSLLEAERSFAVPEDVTMTAAAGGGPGATIGVAPQLQVFATVHSNDAGSCTGISPASRSRFTIIYTAPYSDADIRTIAEQMAQDEVNEVTGESSAEGRHGKRGDQSVLEPADDDASEDAGSKGGSRRAVRSPSAARVAKAVMEMRDVAHGACGHASELPQLRAWLRLAVRLTRGSSAAVVPVKLKLAVLRAARLTYLCGAGEAAQQEVVRDWWAARGKRRHHRRQRTRQAGQRRAALQQATARQQHTPHPPRATVLSGSCSLHLRGPAASAAARGLLPLASRRRRRPLASRASASASAAEHRQRRRPAAGALPLKQQLLLLLLLLYGLLLRAVQPDAALARQLHVRVRVRAPLRRRPRLLQLLLLRRRRRPARRLLLLLLLLQLLLHQLLLRGTLACGGAEPLLLLVPAETPRESAAAAAAAVDASGR
ncbi:Midasin, partial [Tetrabaena socialis]